MVKHPEIEVELTGQNGNIFSLAARVSRALKQNGHADEVDEFYRRVTNAQSYDEALRVLMETVSVR